MAGFAIRLYLMDLRLKKSFCVLDSIFSYILLIKRNNKINKLLICIIFNFITH